MAITLEIIRIVLPIVIVGGIAVFVIKRLQHKYKQGTLGKKNSIGAQILLDSFIPFGAIFGSGIGVIAGIFFQTSMGTTISLGGGAGMLLGYFAYEFYSRKEESYS